MIFVLLRMRQSLLLFSSVISCRMPSGYTPSDWKCYQAVWFSLIQRTPLCLYLGLNCTVNVYKDLSVWCVLHYCVSGDSWLGTWARQKIYSHLISSWLDISKFLIRIASVVPLNMVISKTSFSKVYGNRFHHYQFPRGSETYFQAPWPLPRVFLQWGAYFISRVNFRSPACSWNLHSFSYPCVV